jgi:hypothetical protein
MASWKKLVLVSSSFGVAFAVTIAAIYALTMWYQSRPRAWNTNAIKGSFAGLGMAFQPTKDSYLLEFQFDLQNNTRKNYQIDANAFTMMGNLSKGNVLSKEFGNYQTSDVTFAGPVFIPPQDKVRVTLRVSYQYPPDFTEADKNDVKKVGPSVNRRLSELSGIVIFDQQNHYRIDLPGGWKKWDDIKSQK